MINNPVKSAAHRFRRQRLMAANNVKSDIMIDNRQLAWLP